MKMSIKAKLIGGFIITAFIAAIVGGIGLYALNKTNDLVTDVDKKSEQIIITKIKREFPSHSILAEESGEENNDASCKWIIDPLDGTTNYTHSFPFFCVSIGVSLGGSMKVGVVYDPSRDEIFTAEEKEGAFLNGKRIDVSKWDSISNSLIATGFAYDISGKVANIDHFKIQSKILVKMRRVFKGTWVPLSYIKSRSRSSWWIAAIVAEN